MVTHAFFKALLFLGSGSVIHGMHHEQDMRQMGALRKLMPITASTFIIGWLAIAGVPPFAGFWSKDEILLFALAKSPALYVLGLVTAILTAFYMTRQVIMVFFGEAKWESHAEEHGAHGEFKPHESPVSCCSRSSCWPVLSTVGGVIQLPAFGFIPDDWQNKLGELAAPGGRGRRERTSPTPAPTTTRDCWRCSRSPVRWPASSPPYAIYVRKVRKPVEPEILAEGWRYDATVSAFMGGPGRKVFEAVAWFDKTIIDGAVNGAGKVVSARRRSMRRGQTGNVRNYAGIVGVGVVLLLAWFVIGRGVL